MAMSPAAKALKDRKKSKSKKGEKPKDDAPKAEAADIEVTEDDMKVVGDTLDKMAAEELGDANKDMDKADEDMAKADADMAGADMAGADADMGAGEDPVKVFSDVLDLDDITAQAVYAEAMGMPELADMSPKEMAEKIKGNYDMLKNIIVSMGEKAAMAMKAELNQPMGPPDMGGAPDMGPDMGGPPMGPGMSGPGMA